MFGRPPNRVDILTDPSGVTFEECYKRRVQASVAGVTIPFISLTDLKRNKRSSGRLQDLADLEKLPDDSDSVLRSAFHMSGQGSTGNVIAAVCSFFIPGLGQLVQGRVLRALFHFVVTCLLWLVYLGFVGHIWSTIDAALWKPKRR